MSISYRGSSAIHATPATAARQSATTSATERLVLGYFDKFCCRFTNGVVSSPPPRRVACTMSSERARGTVSSVNRFASFRDFLVSSRRLHARTLGSVVRASARLRLRSYRNSQKRCSNISQGRGVGNHMGTREESLRNDIKKQAPFGSESLLHRLLTLLTTVLVHYQVKPRVC